MIYRSNLDNIKVSIICNFVSDWHDMGFDKIFANHRKRESIEARYLIFYFIRRYTKLSYSDIGEVSNAFDIKRKYNHATVLHACNRIQDRVDIEKMFRYQIHMYSTQIESSFDKKSEISAYEDYPQVLSELLSCLNDRKELKEVNLLAMYLRKIRDESSITDTQKNTSMEMV